MKAKIFIIIFLSFLLLSCDSDDDETFIEPEIANITAELLYFKHEVDKENKTESLEYKIQINNLSGFGVKGVPKISTRRMNDPETTYTMLYLNNDIPCEFLEANSNCTVSHTIKETYNIDVTGPDGPTEVQMVNFEYVVLEELR